MSSIHQRSHRQGFRLLFIIDHHHRISPCLHSQTRHSERYSPRLYTLKSKRLSNRTINSSRSWCKSNKPQFNRSALSICRCSKHQQRNVNEGSYSLPSMKSAKFLETSKRTKALERCRSPALGSSWNEL